MAGRQSSPYTGKRSARPAGKPGDFCIVEGEFATIPSTPPFSATAMPRIILGTQYAFSKAWRNLSGPMWSQNQTLGRDRTASRRSAPSPGSRTRREEHALTHRPQMSSGRLFLDRVARQQSPSPLHRHAQTTTRPLGCHSKPEHSTLLKTGTFYFALTRTATDRKAGIFS